MNSNQRRNQIAIKQFRKELEALLGDIGEIDLKVITRAVNEGLADVKRNTPVGQYSRNIFYDPYKDHKFNTREITVKASWSVSGKARETIRVGGFLRRSWRSPRATKFASGVEKELVNTADYASFVNYGHRVVNRNGETVGFVKGNFMLEKAKNKVDRALEREFKAEVERVNKRHDK